MKTLARSLLSLFLFPLAASKRQSVWQILVVFLLALPSMAQERPQAMAGAESQAAAQSPSRAPAENAASDEANTTLPAGTRLALVLTHPVDTRTTHRGDDIYTETTAPVTLDKRVVMPAGTFVQGKVEKLTRHGTRAEMVMRSVAIIFPDGYVTNIGGLMTIESEEGTAWINPGTSTKAGVVAAPLVGLGLGTAIGAAAHTTQTTNFAGMTMTTSTPKGIAIGSVVGLAAGGVVSLVLLLRSHHFYMATGSELDMVLPQTVTLARGQRADAGPGQGR
ncbi:MAG TPA: hypothetical protein VMR90_06155 [Candidatus Cybelea sp.]|nr:hypothetical protein [Candidatus Cybelea sp.]